MTTFLIGFFFLVMFLSWLGFWLWERWRYPKVEQPGFVRFVPLPPPRRPWDRRN